MKEGAEARLKHAAHTTAARAIQAGIRAYACRKKYKILHQKWKEQQLSRHNSPPIKPPLRPEPEPNIPPPAASSDEDATPNGGPCEYEDLDPYSKKEGAAIHVNPDPDESESGSSEDQASDSDAEKP